jgi:hypothetical protein
MRFLTFCVAALAFAANAVGQSCTGLCLQQLPASACPTGSTTTITGTVYTPNGTDPLPNAVVYIPNAPVDAFTPGVSCPAVGTPPSGSPLVGSMTAVDGTFTITNVPVGANIPIVIQSGRWRRQLTVPSTTACTTTNFSARMPRNQSEGDIPKFAIATGMADQVECVLRKVGVDDSEFTDPGGNGRINLFTGDGSGSNAGAGGARIDGSTPSETTLMATAATLNSYDVLMLPCEGNSYTKTNAELTNFLNFANSGGRVYSSHYSYVYMFQNPPFDTVVNWAPKQAQLPDGIATVDTSFADGQTLAQWLQLVGATTTQGQMPISTLRHDLNGVNPPTQSWLTLNDASAGNPVMQFVFNTPVSTTANQCGRVLFNEYHVENPPSSPTGQIFPAECSTAAITPQEKLLEYSLFELTNNGGAATLTPTTQDFGSEPVGFSSAAHSFVWTNQATFPASVGSVATTGDFAVTANTCSGATIAAGGTCQIGVVFTPTALGARTGTLTVGSNGSTLISTLTGNGTTALTVSATSLDFGSVDVGATGAKTILLTNNAPGSLAVPGFATTGDFTATSACGASIPAMGTCAVSVIFKPSATGPRTGTFGITATSAAYTITPVSLTGNGVDFSIVATPTSGSVIAGDGTSMSTLTAPIAGFASTVTLSCTTTAPASTCTPAALSFIPAATTNVAITTTSEYTVIGYGGFVGFMSFFAVGTGLLLWNTRRRAHMFARYGAFVLLLCAGSLGLVSLTGCTGKLPDRNASYTPPGTYTYTMTATDGFLIHSATYSLKVTVR